MTIGLSIHHVKTISASTVQGGECSPHLTINFEGATHFDGEKNYEASGYITFYLKDAELNERLIRAINETVRDYKKTKETA